MPVNVGSAYGEIIIDISGMEASLNRAQSLMRQTGKKLTGLGKTLTKGITLPIVGIGTAAAKMGIDFEESFAGVRKTVDLTEEEFDRLRQGFLDMATDAEKPVSGLADAQNKLARIGELAGQLGVEGVDNILGFSEVIAELGMSTDLTTEQAATMLAQFANIVDMPIEDVDRLGSVIVDLGNNFATTESTIVEYMHRLAGAGETIGLTESAIAAFGATMASVGINVEAGGTAMSRVFVDMAQATALGGDKLRAFATVAGMTADEFKVAFEEDAAGAIQAFIEGLGGIEDTGGNVFQVLENLELNNVRVRDALLRTSGASDVLSEALVMANDAWQENTALSEEAAKRFETTQSKINAVVNTLRNMGIVMADTVLPIFKDFLTETVSPLILQLADLEPKFVQWGLAIAGVAAAAGPVLMVLGALATAIGALLSPIGLVVVAVAGLATAFATNFMGIRDAVMPVVDGVVEGVKRLVAAFQEGGLSGLLAELETQLRTIGEALIAWAGEQIPKIKAKVLEWAQAFIDWIGPKIPEIVAKLNELAQGVLGWIGEQIPKIVEKLKEWGEAFVTWAKETWPKVKEKLVELADKLQTWITETVSKIKEKLKEWGETFVTWLEEENVPGRLLEELGTLIGKVLGWIIHTGVPKLIEGAMKLGEALVNAFKGGEGGEPSLVSRFVTYIAEQLIPSIVTAVLNALDPLIEAGKSIVSGLVEGVKAKAGELVNAAVDAVRGAIDAVKERLGIGSPSTVFIEIGKALMAGLEIGIGEGESDVLDRLGSVMSSMGRGIEAMLEGLEALGSYQGIGEWSSVLVYYIPALDAFKRDLSLVIQRLGEIADDLGPAMVEAAGDVAEVVDDIGQALSSITEGLAALASYEAIGEWSSVLIYYVPAVDDLKRDLRAIIEALGAVAVDVGDAVPMAKQFASDAAEVLGKVQEAVESLNALQGIGAEPYDLVAMGKNLVASLVDGFIQEAEHRVMDLIMAVARMMMSLTSTIVDMASTIRDVGNSVGEALIEGMIEGLEGEESSLYATIRRIIDRALAEASSVAGAESQRRGGAVARQYGGPVMSGMPYLVGERGMELFVPQSAGIIRPAYATAPATSAGGQGDININVNTLEPASVSHQVDLTMRRLRMEQQLSAYRG